MKTLLWSLSMLISSLAFAQNDVEESMDNLPLIDNSVSAVAYNIKGVYQIDDSLCDRSIFQSLKYPGGTLAYVKELKEQLQKNNNWSNYTVNGPFFIRLFIDKNGTQSKIEAGPNVANSNALLTDLKAAAEGVNKTWTPAKCNGTPIDSKAVVKIDFSSMSYDNAFN